MVKKTILKIIFLILCHFPIFIFYPLLYFFFISLFDLKPFYIIILKYLLVQITTTDTAINKVFLSSYWLNRTIVSNISVEYDVYI